MGRKQQKLILTNLEISLIKGLIDHTSLNDQMIVSIFSHLTRTINHREIGYFRDLKNEKYKSFTPATKQEVEAFLGEYGRFEQVAKRSGVLPQEAHFQQLQKACEAMKSAVSIYNNPNIKWKSEIFIVNSIIAWTYLLHAYYSTIGVDCRYKKSGDIVFTDEGRPKYWELSKCIKAIECPLPSTIKNNIRYLITIRNEIEHRLSDNVDSHLAPKLQACAINFNSQLCKLFGDSHSIAEDLGFAIQFAEISLNSRDEITGAKGLPEVIRTANKVIETEMSTEEYNSSEYSYRVYVIPRTINNKNKADQAVIYEQAGSKVEVAIREMERPKYTAKQIVEQLRSEGFSDFSVHGKGGFVDTWKSLDGKNPKKSYGIEVAAGTWFWYDKMLDAVRQQLNEAD